MNKLLNDDNIINLYNYHIPDNEDSDVKDLYLVDSLVLSFLIKNEFNKDINIGVFSCALEDTVSSIYSAPVDTTERKITNLHGFIVDLDSQNKKKDRVNIKPLIDEICDLTENPSDNGDAFCFYPDFTGVKPDDLVNLLDTSSDVRDLISSDIELKACVDRDNVSVVYKNTYTILIKHEDKYFDISNLGELKQSISNSNFNKISKLNDFFLGVSLEAQKYVKDNFCFIPKRIIEVLTGFNANENYPKYSNFFWNNYDKIIEENKPNLLLNLAEKAFKENGGFVEQRAKALDLVAKYVIGSSVIFRFSQVSMFNPTSSPGVFSYYFQQRMLTSELHDKVTCWDKILSVKSENPYTIRLDSKNNGYSVKISPLSSVIKYVIDSGNYFSEGISVNSSTFSVSNANVKTLRESFVKFTARVTGDVLGGAVVERDLQNLQLFIEKDGSDLLSTKGGVSVVVNGAITRMSEFCTNFGRSPNIYKVEAEFEKMKTNIKLRLNISEKVLMDVKKHQVSQILYSTDSKTENSSPDFKI